MSWVAAAVAGGAAVNYYSSQQAAGAQRDAANQANETQLYMYNQNRADTQPWRETGVMALDRLKGGMDSMTRDFSMQDFREDPGYQFRMREGSKALEKSAAARGSLMSGATLKSLGRYSQDLASQEYGNAYNRYNNDRTTRFNMLSNLAGLGQTSTAQMNQAGQNYATNVGNNQMAIGNANAAGYMGASNAVNNGMNNWMQYQMIQKL